MPSLHLKNLFRWRALWLSVLVTAACLSGIAWAADVRGLLNEGARSASQGDWRDAQRAYQRALQQEPGNPHAMLGMAAAQRGQGQLAAARSTLEALVASHPNFQQAYYLLGLVYEAQGDAGKAKQAFQRYVSLGNVPPDPQLRLKLRQLGVY